MSTSPFMGRPVIAVVRHGETAVAADIARAAVTVLPAVEITFTVPDAAALISELRDDARVVAGEVVVGAGTVLSAGDAETVIAAGASFLVSPTLDTGVAAAAAEAGVPYVPGAFTPTEVLAAASHGCGVVKLFPASVLGPAFLRAVGDVAPDVAVVPTGGIGATHIAEWFAAGAHAVGVGGSLVAAHRRGGAAAVADEAARLLALAAPTDLTPASSLVNGAPA